MDLNSVSPLSEAQTGLNLEPNKNFINIPFLGVALGPLLILN